MPSTNKSIGLIKILKKNLFCDRKGAGRVDQQFLLKY